MKNKQNKATVTIMNASDVKFLPDNTVKIKRKYGDFKRPMFQFDGIDESEKKPLN